MALDRELPLPVASGVREARNLVADHGASLAPVLGAPDHVTWNRHSQLRERNRLDVPSPADRATLLSGWPKSAERSARDQFAPDVRQWSIPCSRNPVDQL